MWKWILAAIVLGTIGLVALDRWNDRTTVDVAAARRTAIESWIEETGRTRLARTHVVATPFAGLVERVALEPGDLVVADEIVARLDTEPLRVRLEAAKARVAALDARIDGSRDDTLERTLIEQIDGFLVALDRTVDAAEERTRGESARSELLAEERRRTEASFAEGSVTEIELLRARVDETAGDVELRSAFLTLRSAQAIRIAARLAPVIVEQYVDRRRFTTLALQHERSEALAEVALLERDLARADMRAPVSGVVLARHVDAPRELATGSAVVEIGETSDLEIELELLTQDAALVRTGAPVRLIGPAPFDGSTTGRVARIDPRAFIDVSSLGIEQERVRVRVTIPDDAVLDALGVGWRARARIVLGDSIGVTIPRASATRTADGSWRAWAVVDGRAVERAVEVGVMNDESIEITAGVDDGDLVIVAPDAELRDGDRVRIR